MTVAGSDNSALLVQDTRFDPRLQLQSSVRFGGGTRFRNGLRIAAGFGLTRTLPSSAVVGYVYPGWIGREAWLMIGYADDGWVADSFGPRNAAPERDMAFGVELDLAGVLAGYDATYLLSFFPTIGLTPIIVIALGPRTTAACGLAVEWQIRRDLALANSLPGALSLGITVELRSYSANPVTAEDAGDRQSSTVDSAAEQ